MIADSDEDDSDGWVTTFSKGFYCTVFDNKSVHPSFLFRAGESVLGTARRARSRETEERVRSLIRSPIHRTTVTAY